MDKQKLVKQIGGLKRAILATPETRSGLIRPAADAETLDRAIAYIQYTPSRDEVLEKVERMASGLCELDQDWFIKKIRALKSTPTFTRADGTTSPVRGGEEDRRKSEWGSFNEHGKTPADTHRRRVGTFRGRRSGDRARRTGEAAPGIECEHLWLPPIKGTTCCRRCGTEKPAQEAPQPAQPCQHEEGDSEYGGRGTCVKCGSPWPPEHSEHQPEQPSLVDAWCKKIGGREIDDWAVPTEIRRAFVWLLHQLDARLGSKQP